MNDAVLFGRQASLFQITWCQIPQDRNQNGGKKIVLGVKKIVLGVKKIKLIICKTGFSPTMYLRKITIKIFVLI